MTVRLRPHHLLCLLTYVGKGYSPAFVDNYDRIAARLTGGEDILIVEEPDDICRPLLEDVDPHCRQESVAARDRQAAHDVGRLLDMDIVAGLRMTLTGGLLEQMRQAFSTGHSRSACAGCEWGELCSTIAASGFGQARVHR